MALDYAEVETVLARLHHADAAAQQGAFRGRIAHLRRLGVPIGLNPGKGKRISYKIEQVYQLALCLEIEEFGTDPSLVVSMVKQHWELGFRLDFWRAERYLTPSSEDDLCFLFYPSFMSAGWYEQARAPALKGITAFSTVRNSIAVETLSRLTDDRRRACIINLSEVVRLIRVTIADLGLADRLNNLDPSA